MKLILDSPDKNSEPEKERERKLNELLLSEERNKWPAAWKLISGLPTSERFGIEPDEARADELDLLARMRRLETDPEYRKRIQNKNQELGIDKMIRSLERRARFTGLARVAALPVILGLVAAIYFLTRSETPVALVPGKLLRVQGKVTIVSWGRESAGQSGSVIQEGDRILVDGGHAILYGGKDLLFRLSGTSAVKLEKYRPEQQDPEHYFETRWADISVFSRRKEAENVVFDAGPMEYRMAGTTARLRIDYLSGSQEIQVLEGRFSVRNRMAGVGQRITVSADETLRFSKRDILEKLQKGPVRLRGKKRQDLVRFQDEAEKLATGTENPGEFDESEGEEKLRDKGNGVYSHVTMRDGREFTGYFERRPGRGCWIHTDRGTIKLDCNEIKSRRNL